MSRPRRRGRADRARRRLRRSAPDSRRPTTRRAASTSCWRRPSVSETVTVTATRSEQRTGDLPASVSVLSRQEIRQSPAVVADDVLRQIPTFSLFRRTSSLSSHPTAQGVSLRGIGPSGVSRTLVLLDGVPFNDPFGGWVVLDARAARQPRAHRSRRQHQLEPVRQLRDGRRDQPHDRRRRRAGRSSCARSTATATARRSTSSASDVWGKLGVVVDGSAFRTDGYPIVAAARARRGRQQRHGRFPQRQRQAAVRPDRPRAGDVPRRLLPREPRQRQGQHHRSARKRPTTRPGRRSAAARASACRIESTLQVSLFGDVETFRSNFLAVPAATPPRSIGRMTLNQRVPTNAIGGLAQWSRGVGRQPVRHARHRLAPGRRRQRGGRPRLRRPARRSRCAGSRAARSAASGSSCRTL